MKHDPNEPRDREPLFEAGRMLLAAHAMQPKLGLIVAADLDPICAKMCALNFWLHGVP
jgi:hypothetical protein